MCPKVAIVYNQPEPGRYADMGESAAIAGVIYEVEAAEQALSDLKNSSFRPNEKQRPVIRPTKKCLHPLPARIQQYRKFWNTEKLLSLSLPL